MYKLGIIGAGEICSAYVKALRNIQGIELKAIADIDYEKLQRYRHVQGLVTCQPDEIFEQEMNGVLIATPNSYHAGYVLKALSEGLDAICEKPLAISLDDVKTLTGLTKRSMLYMALHCRFRPECQYALNNLKGQVEVFRQYYCENWLNAPQWYFNPVISGGGVLLDVGINQIDWMIQLLEQPLLKTALIKKHHYAVDVEADLTWEHSKGKGKTILGWNTQEEKKQTYIKTTSQDEYILDHIKHTVHKNEKLIFMEECREYEGVLLDFLEKRRTGRTEFEKRIIELFSILGKAYELNNEDFLSSKYNSLNKNEGV